jgi:glucose-1-phosphate thymidylyltransferase
MSRIECLETTGVVLGGGNGTRLAPFTNETSKHLLPVGDKPLIFYPIEQLLQAGVKDILLLIDERYASQFMTVLNDGSHLGIRSLAYIWQSSEGKGLPSAINQVKHHVNDGRIVVVCGDVIIENGIEKPIKNFRDQVGGARMVATGMEDTAGYSPLITSGGAVENILLKDRDRHTPGLIDLGIYMYTPGVFERIKTLVPSKRGETEMRDLNRTYAKEGQLKYTVVYGWWSDVGGSIDTYIEANRRYANR